MFKQLFYWGAAPVVAAALVLNPGPGQSKALAQRGRPAPNPGGVAPSGAPIGAPGTPNAVPSGTTSPTQTAPGASTATLPNPVYGSGYNPLAPFSPINPVAGSGNAAIGLNPVSPTGGFPTSGPLLNPLATGGNMGTDMRPIQTNPFGYYNYGFPYGYGLLSYGFAYGSGNLYGSGYNPPTMSRYNQVITDTPGWVSNVQTVMGTGQPSARIGPPAPGTTPSEPSPGEVIIRVPAEAKVWINGKELQGSGPERVFRTPDLRPGNLQTVSVKASWNQDGYDINRTASVVVQPGDQKSIIFMGASHPSE